MFEVEVVSREFIKPSSPTPHHLRKYQFSFLDQINPPVFMPLMLFYPADAANINLDRSIQLKSDAGVPYVEARASCQLLDVIRDPIPNELNRYHAFELDDVRDFTLAIQVTFFDCGGMAVAIGVSHKIADALSFFLFINTWAACGRGDNDDLIPRPLFDSATLFPPRNVGGYRHTTGIVKENIVTKRYVFDASKISTLRDKYADRSRAEFSRLPTRIEALSAFIWSRFMEATGAKDDPSKIYTVLHAVNLRTRANPPLPENYFGNISRIAISVPSLGSEEECCGIVNKMREAIRGVNSEYVKKIQEGEHFNFLKERAASIKSGQVVSFSFTSLCRFPLYEADFGWGKPVWVGSASLPFKNLIVFLDTKSGGGIETWINFKKEDMAKFEVDEEFLAHVSPSPDAKTLGV
ncbi:hypothetical protein RJ639_008568 [Escallonia herrerae]|uniref:Vinorine synthase-like n=1 Tax=Escallonia herrerae TaxID=1293975 RepID=A0AA88VXD3_9ASTE|nr:hypothetical protein RJ639_008568 [Escallonia herrerae]